MTDKDVAGAGALINSALYLLLVATAGFHWNNEVAALLAITSVGVTYLSYGFAYHGRTSSPLSVGSNLLGIAAGVALVVGCFT